MMIRDKDKIALPFNKDYMSVVELKKAASTLEGILEDFDKFSDDPEEFFVRVMQVRGFYKLKKDG